MLSDGDLRKKIEQNEIKIEPIEDYQIQSASVDLRLSDEFMVPEGSDLIHLTDPQEEILKEVKGDFILDPKQFALGRTIEKVKVPPHLTAFIEGRSSVGRKGLFIENAGWIDPGFEGTITLELFNATNSSIKINPKTRICQIVFASLESEAQRPYGEKKDSKYQGQIKPTGSRIHRDHERDKEERED